MKIFRKCKLFTTKLFSLLTIFMTFALLGCSPKETKAPTIDLGDGNFLLPGGKNRYGCTEYRLMNEEGLPTAQMLYYVDKEMNYSGSYDKDNCL